MLRPCPVQMLMRICASHSYVVDNGHERPYPLQPTPHLPSIALEGRGIGQSLRRRIGLEPQASLRPCIGQAQATVEKTLVPSEGVPS